MHSQRKRTFSGTITSPFPTDLSILPTLPASFPEIDTVLHCGYRVTVLYSCHSSPIMKPSTYVKYFLVTFICTASTLKANLLIPDEDGPHANKTILFNGSLSFWANELYGFSDGKAVEFDNAGVVTIGDTVSPQSVLVKGSGSTTWEGLGQITGDTSVVKEGSGALAMNAANSYTGGTQIKEGLVKAGGATSFGSGPIEVSGGVLNLSGHEIINELHLSGGQIQGSAVIGNQVVFHMNYNIVQDVSARAAQLEEGTELSVAKGATLNLEEEMVLHASRALNLSAGGEFRGQLLVEQDGILNLTTEGSTAIAAGSTWHFKGATVNGNLSTEAGTRSANRESKLKISSANRLNGALTLNGGILHFTDKTSSIHAKTLVLSSPTTLQWDSIPEEGEKRTFITYNRLLSGTVTDYYDFFGVNQEQYELNVTAQGISLTTLNPDNTTDDSTEDTPVINPNPGDDTTPGDDTAPGIEDDTQDPPSDPGPNINGDNDTDKDSNSDKDDPHGPEIDTSGDDPDDPHNNKEEDSTTPPADDSADVDDILSPEIGTALSQAAIQSAWSARFATHAFMSAVHDNSRAATSTTWAAFYGGLRETDNDGIFPGGDSSVYGIAIGAKAHPTHKTQVGLAVGGALGSVSGDSFGELDQLSLHAALYAERSFLKQDSRYRLNLYGAIGLSRTETDPGIYSGLENWHYNGLTAHTRLSWGMKLRESIIWSIYGGAEYYNGSNMSVDDERISGLTSLSSSIGSGIAWETQQATLYAEAEFTGDILLNSPTATVDGNEYRTAEPARSGFLLRCGVQLRPEGTQRCINLNYAYESRSSSSAHVLSVGITQVF